ncbi:MAG: DUF4136 domain-containing protein [Bacteroidota bacterium]
MKTKVLYVLVFANMIIGCASSGEVVYDYNLETDFENYNTFVVCTDDMTVTNTSFPNYDNETIRAFLADAVEDEMKLRDHTLNNLEPQLQVGFKIVLREETTSFRNCTHSDELEYWEDCKVHDVIYMQETLIVYVSDFETLEVLWQASVSSDMNTSKNKLKSNIDEMVSRLFATYPRAKSNI